MFDSLIAHFDTALRTLAGVARAARPTPAGHAPGGAEADDAALTPGQRQLAARLMRVNHCGEVCAQALYQGQALASRDAQLSGYLQGAAREEQDHLAWSAERIHELGGHTSLLNPLWYAGSLALGYAAGRAGDHWNLGFLVETEQQVGQHLGRHLARLPEADQRTRVVISAMQQDELRHAQTARSLGAAELPAAVKLGMRLASGIMTRSSYWV